MALAPAAARADEGKEWPQRVYIGGLIGLDMATHAGPGANDEFVSTSYKPGFSISGAVGLRLTERWAVQTELAYTTKGPHAFMDGMEAGTFHMQYLEVPLLARVMLPVGGRGECYGVLGPALGILLDADIDLTDGRQLDLENSFDRSDFGLMLGAGAAVDIGSTDAITIDIRYNWGIPNIDKTAAPENDDVMNRTIYFMVGYRTDLSRFLGDASNESTPAASEPNSTPALTNPTE